MMFEGSSELKPGNQMKKPNKTRHATPISRPVFMIFRSLNLNPVIDVRHL